ncbi:RNA-directed DNA polymerase, eukaryota, reverse transcriptase zinc-binding domain protein [Tanacetum coccineum]
MLGGRSADCDLNNKLNENECEENTSEKLNQDCVDDSNKECLDNNDKLSKDQISENISWNIDDKQDDELNNAEYSNSDNDADRIGSKKTYASAIKNSGWFESNKLFVVPTVLNELGDEVVVFDEELVELGSKKWELTLLFKFSNEIGMVTVANQSPWMVNSKPLMVQKSDPSIGMSKSEPTKIPVWVKLTDLPMEAWTTKGISAVSSSMGRPLIMDSMTAYVCKNGVGRTEYGRVLVEIEASKGFKETIELQYRDNNMNVKGSKTVKVTYDWKPLVCSHCLVFGHDHKNCKVRVRTTEEITSEKLNVEKQLGEKKENEFIQNKGRRPAGSIRTNKPGQTNYNRTNYMPGEGYRRFTGYNKQQWNKKVNNSEENNASKNKDQCVEEERPVKINKNQNVTSSNKDPQTSNNSFSVLRDLDDDNIQGLNMLKDKIIVDKYLNIKMQPSLNDMEGFVEDVEDVYEDDGIVAKNLVADEFKGRKQKEVKKFIYDEKLQVFSVIETHVKAPKLSKVYERVFGQWDWVSNIDQCNGGCRITVGWNNDEVNVLVVHSTSFIYAANAGMERRILWNDLQLAKCITNGLPWVIMGDFNVTLKLEEHSASSSVISCDMQDFIDCVNLIEVEDVCMTSMYYTWIKSPSNPSTSILKKLDRIMANEEFISKYNQAFVVFHPFMISDHSHVVLTISNSISKKKKSFKIANFVADKKEFMDLVENHWHEEVEGFHMFRLTKKLKLLKKHIKKLQWMNGDIFARVENLRSKLKDVQHEVAKFPFDSKKKEIAVATFEEFHEALNDEEKRNRNRVLSINNDVGESVEGSKIADEFVKHFVNFLGQAFPVQHLDSLDDIFTKTLSHEEAATMINDVTNQEIKLTMFSIDDCKAPGPDGYTACFFKKAWSVIGNDVCLAVKEFFNSGKMLKEINSTLIALIPKVHHPKLVTEFRPIACCNVLYKCISKILTNRIKESLNKLVNLNQSAFIQGRNIQDNILLTQELLKGYNRKGGSKRCALKIDIAKAYDTVFTLIMAKNVDNSSDFKYHPGCKELKMTHLCFADDFLVICHGSVESVKVIKDSIDEFSKVSGLEPNLSKSTIFFGNVNMGEQRNILNVMPFKVGRFPVKYLGVPLITKRLGRGECKQLIDKVRNKVDDWKNKSLSYAGQLIASVLNSMQVYWACVFLLPKTAVKDIERILKGFLWCHGDLTRGKAKIAWKTLCKPKCQGGLGFKELGMWNEVLLTRHIWNIAANKESVWVKWVHIVKLKAKQHIEYIVGNGKRISAWYDKWNEMGPLCQIIDSRDLYNARYDKKATVADMIHNNQWRWKDELNNVFPELNNIQVPTLSEDQDKSMWRCSNGELKQFSIRQT